MRLGAFLHRCCVPMAQSISFEVIGKVQGKLSWLN